MSVHIQGTYMDRSLNDFTRACEEAIANEHEKPLPEGELIALLEDAVRLAREMARVQHSLFPEARVEEAR